MVGELLPKIMKNSALVAHLGGSEFAARGRVFADPASTAHQVILFGDSLAVKGASFDRGTRQHGKGEGEKDAVADDYFPLPVSKSNIGAEQWRT